MKKQSAIYKRNGKAFRYDYRSCLVSLMMKAGPEERQENENWIARFGRPLWDIDEDGYMELSTVGLMREDWDDKEARNEYLDGWMEEMEEETACMAERFVKNELPYLQMEA